MSVFASRCSSFRDCSGSVARGLRSCRFAAAAYALLYATFILRASPPFTHGSFAFSILAFRIINNINNFAKEVWIQRERTRFNLVLKLVTISFASVSPSTFKENLDNRNAGTETKMDLETFSSNNLGSTINNRSSTLSLQ